MLIERDRLKDLNEYGKLKVMDNYPKALVSIHPEFVRMFRELTDYKFAPGSRP